MSFAMKLVRPDFLLEPAAYDNDVDDIRVLSMDGGAQLQAAGYSFVVSGFGQERWPADVEYDFAMILELLPEVLLAVRAGQSTTLEFWGQGVERIVDITLEGDEAIARCRSGTAWDPDPVVERLGRAALEKQLSALGRDFVAGLALVSPLLASSVPAQELLALSMDIPDGLDVSAGPGDGAEAGKRPRIT